MLRPELRRWLGGDPVRTARHRDELRSLEAAAPCDRLRALAHQGDFASPTAPCDREHIRAVLLQTVLEPS